MTCPVYPKTEPTTVQYPSHCPATMDLSDVEMLSASLIREYLARKRLAQTLTQLDEEQAVFSSCVRNRPQLVRELQIGRLVKRNKQLGSQLRTMLEMIVCFLLQHAKKRKEKRGKAEEKENESDCSVIRNEGTSERNEGSEREIVESEKISFIGTGTFVSRGVQREDGTEGHGRDVAVEKPTEERMEQVSLTVRETTKATREHGTEIRVEEPEISGELHFSSVISNKELCDIKNRERKQSYEEFNQEERRNNLVCVEGNCEGVGDICGINEGKVNNKTHAILLDTREFIEDRRISTTCEDKTSVDPRTKYSDCENSSICELQTNEVNIVCEHDSTPRYNTTDFHGSESMSHSLQILTLENTCTLVDSENTTLKNSSYSDTEESQTDTDCSISSVVDLLKDAPDMSDNRPECGMTLDVFRKGRVTSIDSATYPPRNETDDRTPRDNTRKEAWGEAGDNSDLQGTEKQTSDEPRKSIHKEVQEKWARERSEEDMESAFLQKSRTELEASTSEEEAAPAEIATATSSRPGTQESRPSPWLQENGVGGGGGRRSPGLLRIDTYSSLHKRSFDDALDTFRSELRNGLSSPTLSHTHLNGHTPNGLTSSRREWQPLESSRSSQQQGRRSVFDADLEVDIATMAAQRDQLRGARNVRGMMAPVISKEEESRSRSANRKLQIPRHRSDSTLDHHSTYETHQDTDLASHEQDDTNQGDVLGSLVVGRRTGGRGMLGGLSGVGLRPRGDYLDINARGDIMAQSMRRQSLRGSKQSLLEGLDMDSSSRASGDGASPEERLESQGGDGGEQAYGESRRKSVPKFIPNSHEDIQILNLQGFMDMGNFDVGGGGGGGRRRHKKKRVRRCSDTGGVLDRAREAYKFNSKPSRRKRNHRSHSSDDEGEMVLRDVDEIDTKVAGLVLGPEKTVGKEQVGRPITLEEAGALRSLLTGGPGQSLPSDWLAQNFRQNSNPNLSYGLIQKKGGPCGVLACVQSYLVKVLVFGSTVVQVPTPVSPLRPSQREWQWALSAALTEILWKAGQGQKALLATPGPFPSFTETGTGQWTRDGLTENLIIGEYATPGLLQEALNRLLPALTAESGPGCVILLYSLILTRGIANIHTDMDPGGGHLINAHGYSSQEIVNLFLVGRAATNTFDGERSIGSDHSAETMVLKGITARAEIGMLSLFEHYDCYKVGSYLKTPQYPVWVVCCESHYSCLFSRDTTATSDTPASHTFDVYYYDGLALQEDEIRLTIDLDGDKGDPPIVPPLENCIRTKWKEAAINWNGTDPIL